MFRATAPSLGLAQESRLQFGSNEHSVAAQVAQALLLVRFSRSLILRASVKLANTAQARVPVLLGVAVAAHAWRCDNSASRDRCSESGDSSGGSDGSARRVD